MAVKIQARRLRRVRPPSVRVNLLDTNPKLYRSLMMVAGVFVVLGLNFLLTTPTFQQYDVPKNLIGVVALVLGVVQFIVLNLHRNLKLVRISMIFGMVFTAFWGFGTTETAFAGESSWQLPILYLALFLWLSSLLGEPFYDLVTANKKNGEIKK